MQTVQIQTDNGPVKINKEDFDEKKHKLANDSKPKGRPKKDK